jgi:hypothetical protein
MKISGTSGKHQALVLLVVFVALSLIGFGASAGAGGAAKRPMCEEKAIVDYLAPFRSMPAASPPPPGRLPFGPRSLQLREANVGQVVVGNRPAYGYVAMLEGSSARSRKPLNWIVAARLEAVNRSGKQQRVVAHRRWRIPDLGDLNGRMFSLRINRSEGLYRFALVFRRANGDLLKKYTQYVRAVSAKSQSAILINKDNFRAGERVVIQLANTGTIDVGYGEGGSISALQNGQWEPVLSLPSSGKRRAFVLGPGELGACEGVLLPSNLPPGSYRIEKRISYNLGQAAVQVLTNDFTVEA